MDQTGEFARQVEEFRAIWRQELAAVAPGMEGLLHEMMGRTIQACLKEAGGGGAVQPSAVQAPGGEASIRGQDPDILDGKACSPTETPAPAQATAGDTVPSTLALRFTHVGVLNPRPDLESAGGGGGGGENRNQPHRRRPAANPPPVDAAGVQAPGLHGSRLLAVQEQQQEALQGGR